MKVIAILAVMLMVFGLIVMVPAAASADNTPQEICSLFSYPNFVYDNMGDCVSSAQDWPFVGNGNDWAPDLCKHEVGFRSPMPFWQKFGFKNLGQCVSFF